MKVVTIIISTLVGLKEAERGAEGEPPESIRVRKVSWRWSTGDTILRHLPILKDDGSSSVAMGWGELQFRESEVVLAAMEILAFEHDVPALPVHDSIIVPKEASDLAKVVLGETFRAAFGIAAEIA